MSKQRFRRVETLHEIWKHVNAQRTSGSDGMNNAQGTSRSNGMNKCRENKHEGCKI
jgi:hypothetical protein